MTNVFLSNSVSNLSLTLVMPPLDPVGDIDGDGMKNGDEVALGLDPLVSNAFSRLPFTEYFETNTVSLGDISENNGCRVLPIPSTSWRQPELTTAVLHLP